MNIIEVDHVTKNYGRGRGIFDLCFQGERGKVIGLLGPNGAGKTTLIRHLMGFSVPDSGQLKINGLDCSRYAERIHELLGYLPGEMAFMNDMTGSGFLTFMAQIKRMEQFDFMKDLLDRFELDPRGRISRMSKGMKQKLGIVCTFMNRPDVLILDEPTSGLDPLMQGRFVDLILEERKRGASILMASHIFEEIEKTCDEAIMMKRGRIVEIEDVQELQSAKQSIFRIVFETPEMAYEFLAEPFRSRRIGDCSVRIAVGGEWSKLIQALSHYQVTDISEEKQTLEELFLQRYGGGRRG